MMNVYVLWMTKVDRDGHDDSYWSYQIDEQVMDRVVGVFDTRDAADMCVSNVDKGADVVKCWIEVWEVNKPRYIVVTAET